MEVNSPMTPLKDSSPEMPGVSPGPDSMPGPVPNPGVPAEGSIDVTSPAKQG